MKRICLGSGQKPYDPPFINIDIQERWKPDIVADGSCLPMFEDASADLIVCEHTLEHYGCNEGTAMLQECHRILTPGGSLIISVPDMRELAKAWLRGQLTTETYVIAMYGAFMGNEADRHKFGYDSLSLATYLMGTASWAKIKTFDYRPIEGMKLAADFWILALEATR